MASYVASMRWCSCELGGAHPPLSNLLPSWLLAFGPTVARSGQRGGAHKVDPASTASSARTCRWEWGCSRVRDCRGPGPLISELSSQSSGGRELTLHHHSFEAAPCDSPGATSRRVQHRSCHSRACLLQRVQDSLSPGPHGKVGCSGEQGVSLPRLTISQRRTPKDQLK